MSTSLKEVTKSNPGNKEDFFPYEEHLDNMNATKSTAEYQNEVSEKSGLNVEQGSLLHSGFSLAAHNFGSAEIEGYREGAKRIINTVERIWKVMIETGDIPVDNLYELRELIIKTIREG